MTAFRSDKAQHAYERRPGAAVAALPAGYLECGVLAHGFSRVVCRACGDEVLLGFSCKGRGVCPSCNARRAHDTAAHLVDNVLPGAPDRQWTLSFPKRIRWHLARDVRLMSAVRALFLRALFGFQSRSFSCARTSALRRSCSMSLSSSRRTSPLSTCRRS